MSAYERRAASARLIARARSTTRERGIALTFDDGPHPGTTDQVLDILGFYEVRATFFLVGANATRHPHLVQDIVSAGHAIGSHSWSHRLDDDSTMDHVMHEYREGHRALARLGVHGSLFRPPEGRLTGRHAIVLRRLGLRPWLWSIDPRDWSLEADARSIATAFDDAAEGDVVLLHDWVEGDSSRFEPDRTQTIAALPVVLEGLRGRRLAVVPLR